VRRGEEEKRRRGDGERKKREDTVTGRHGETERKEGIVE
jgi:hypothetical protein